MKGLSPGPLAPESVLLTTLLGSLSAEGNSLGTHPPPPAAQDIKGAFQKFPIEKGCWVR